jgi:hypothetical protein
VGHGGRAGGEVRARKESGRVERGDEPVLVLRVGEHPGLGCDELGRTADAGCHDRAARRHGLERREPERLDEARLAENVAGGYPSRNL